MAGWLHGVFVGEWLFVLPLCGLSLSLFCNYEPADTKYTPCSLPSLLSYTHRVTASPHKFISVYRAQRSSLHDSSLFWKYFHDAYTYSAPCFVPNEDANRCSQFRNFYALTLQQGTFLLTIRRLLCKAKVAGLLGSHGLGLEGENAQSRRARRRASLCVEPQSLSQTQHYLLQLLKVAHTRVSRIKPRVSTGSCRQLIRAWSGFSRLGCVCGAR